MFYSTSIPASISTTKSYLISRFHGFLLTSSLLSRTWALRGVEGLVCRGSGCLVFSRYNQIRSNSPDCRCMPFPYGTSLYVGRVVHNLFTASYTRHRSLTSRHREPIRSTYGTSRLASAFRLLGDTADGLNMLRVLRPFKLVKRFISMEAIESCTMHIILLADAVESLAT